MSPVKKHLFGGLFFLMTATGTLTGIPAMADQVVHGLATWYGPGFSGNRTASGEIFNPNALTAAHRTLPFGTQVRVTNLKNGRSVVVRVNDRLGDPAIAIDLSSGAAQAIGMTVTSQVKMEILSR
ncbi:MAG: septal ring lytic transglycosylase RlpA family protein [Nodosilinea sp.]